MNAPGLLAHRDYAQPRSLSGCEMNVRQLGKRVADGIVDCALAYLAAFNMSDGNTHGESDRSRREHLVTVGDEKEYVRPPGGKCISEAKHGDADRLRHARIRIGTEQAFDTGMDGKSIPFDLLNRRPERRREMRAQDKDPEFNIRASGELAKGPIEMAVVGAGTGDHPDATTPRLGWTHAATRSVHVANRGRARKLCQSRLLATGITSQSIRRAGLLLRALQPATDEARGSSPRIH